MVKRQVRVRRKRRAKLKGGERELNAGLNSQKKTNRAMQEAAKWAKKNFQSRGKGGGICGKSRKKKKGAEVRKKTLSSGGFHEEKVQHISSRLEEKSRGRKSMKREVLKKKSVKGGSRRTSQRSLGAQKIREVEEAEKELSDLPESKNSPGNRRETALDSNSGGGVQRESGESHRERRGRGKKTTDPIQCEGKTGNKKKSKGERNTQKKEKYQRVRKRGQIVVTRKERVPGNRKIQEYRERKGVSSNSAQKRGKERKRREPGGEVPGGREGRRKRKGLVGASAVRV